MRILICSYRFSPDVGGIETCSLTLAESFRSKGHSVVIVTQSPSNSSADEDKGFTVLRKPSVFALARAIQNSDVVWQNNISLVWLLIAQLLGKVRFITTATWLHHATGKVRPVDHLKRFVLGFSYNLYISQSIRRHIGWQGKIVANPYEHQTFHTLPDAKREKDIVFLGRLVSDKGCDLVLEALSVLKRDEGLTPSFSIIGSGPEEDSLRSQVKDLGLDQQVDFAGVQREDALRNILNQHKILVVPSRWLEPFGIVALEGLACGLTAIVSSGGGLPEAVGNCGIVFENNNTEQLAHALKRILTDQSLNSKLLSASPEHLERFKADAVADSYLNSFALGA